MRPGRFDVQIEIGLPDEYGRKQILGIHMKEMIKNNILSDEIKIDELAKQTENYTGAEIESVVKSAASFAMKDNFDNENYKPINEEFKITKNILI